MDNKTEVLGIRLLSGHQMKGILKSVDGDTALLQVGDNIEEHLLSNLYVRLEDYLELKETMDKIQDIINKSIKD